MSHRASLDVSAPVLQAVTIATTGRPITIRRRVPGPYAATVPLNSCPMITDSCGRMILE